MAPVRPNRASGLCRPRRSGLVTVRACRCVPTAILGAWVLTLGSARAADTNDYPVRPLRFVVGFTPGGSSDTVARIVGQRLAERLGQQVVIDNRGGASGGVAADLVAKSRPDGYTLLLATPGSITIAPVLKKTLPYDPDRDLQPITQIATTSAVLLTAPSGPQSVRHLIELAKKQPKRLNYASSGFGSSNHLAAELFNTMAGVQMVHVPYKGSGQTLPALLSGEVQVVFGPIVPALPQLRQGRVHALGVTGARRSQAAPEIPTIAEAGLAGYAIDSWYGIAVAAQTPVAVIRRLATESRAIAQEREVRERLIREGADPIGGTPDEFAAYIRTERGKWVEVARAANITPE